MNGPLEAATEAWGDQMPDWIRTLAIECGKSSQSKVAKRLGWSSTVVSQALRNRYGGDMAAFEARVRAVYEDQTLICPALGEMRVHLCQDWQAKSRNYRTGNPLRVRMFRACNACPQNRKEAGDADA